MATLWAPEYSSRPRWRTYSPNRLGAWLLADVETLGQCGKVEWGGTHMFGTVWSVGSLGGWSRGGWVSQGWDRTSFTARRRAGSRRSRAVMRWRARELTHSGTLNSPHRILAKSDDVSEWWNGYLHQNTNVTTHITHHTPHTATGKQW